MSDFLTNLVMRSFFHTASVQPLGAPSNAAPEVLTAPVEELSDPFAETPISVEDEVTVQEEVIQQSRRSANRHPAAQGPIEAELSQPEQASGRQPNISATHELLTEVKEASVVPAVEPSKPDVSLTSTEIARPPIRKGSRASVGPPSVDDVSSGAVELTPSGETATTKSILQRRAANLGNDSPNIIRALKETEPSTRRLMRKQGNAISLSPRTTTSHSERSGPPPTEMLKGDVVDEVIERPAVIENKPQLTATFTALIPKSSAEPLPPFKIKSRPNLTATEARDQEAPLPPAETVINVAIGRIEVRATQAASPRRERPTPGPRVMNLDDYLHQRSRGTQ